MSPAARSINIFGIYLVVIGVVLLMAPNLLRFLFRLPLTTEVWLRVVSVPVFFLAFVLAGWVEWPLLLFGDVGAAGAAWTWKALASRGVTA